MVLGFIYLFFFATLYKMAILPIQLVVHAVKNISFAGRKMAIAQNQQLTCYQGPDPSKTDSEHFEREV